nr:maturase K [Selaginella stauntoniana]
MEAWTTRKMRIKNIRWQQHSLHSPLLRDDTYTIAFLDRSSADGSKFDSKRQGIEGPNKKRSSSATTKRLISSVRGRYSSTFCCAGKDSDRAGGCRKRSSRDRVNIPLEPAMGPLITVSRLHRLAMAKPPLSMRQLNIFRSIYSAFTLMEDDSPRCHCSLDTAEPSRFSHHPETLIRTPRRRIQDAPLSHLPRVTLHGGYPDLGAPKDAVAGCSPVTTSGSIVSLRNHCTYEFGRRSIRAYEQALPRGKVSPRTRALDKTRFTRRVIGRIATKLSRVMESPARVVTLPLREILSSRELPIRYARCINHFIIALEAATPVDKRRHHYPRFRRYYTRVAAHPGMDRSFRDCFAFPCPVSGTRLGIRKVRARMTGNPSPTGAPAKGSLAVAPTTTYLIGLPARDISRGISGRPKRSESARPATPLGDDDVLNRFHRVPASIHYCGGRSDKRNGLYRMRHIFQFPCAKTSARKYRSTIRIMRDGYSLGIFRIFPLSEGRASSPTRVRCRERTNWYSDAIRVDCFVNHSQRKPAPN